MKRRTARPLAVALESALRDATPLTLLARAQSVWTSAAGRAAAAEATPRSERDGVITVACRSAVWAHELDLLADHLLERLNAALGTEEPPARVVGLRFVVGPRHGG